MVGQGGIAYCRTYPSIPDGEEGLQVEVGFIGGITPKFSAYLPVQPFCGGLATPSKQKTTPLHKPATYLPKPPLTTISYDCGYPTAISTYPVYGNKCVNPKPMPATIL